MADQMRARCAEGHVIVSDETVRVELPALPGTAGQSVRQTAMARSAITSIDQRTTVPSVFGVGGAVTLTLHGQGDDVLRITMLSPRNAQAIRAILKR